MHAFLQPLTLILLLMNGSRVLSGEVYRCRAPGLPTQFSQFPCTSPQPTDARVIAPAASFDVSPQASPKVVQDQLTVEDVQSLTIPALSSHERRRLKQAQQRTASKHRSVQRSRARNAGALRRQRALRAERCQTARQRLRDLAMRKRKGYSLGDVGRLTAEELALKNEADETC
jgi:hypothetical protein